MLKTPKNTPVHPGEILREDILPSLGLSIAQFSEKLGVSKSAFSRLLSARSAMSAEMAVRLEMAGFSTARFWLALQARYSETSVRQKKISVRPFAPVDLL